MKKLCLLALLASMLLGPVSLSHAGKPTKWFEVESNVVNTNSGWGLRVSVNHPDCVYREGDELVVNVKAERDCYVYLFYYSGENVACLFPNVHQKDNFVKGGKAFQVPAADADFKITCRPPFGEEVLQVIATKEYYDIFQEDTQKLLTQGNATIIKDFQIESIDKKDDADWAEHRVTITTLGRNDQKPKVGRRFGVCVGISEYEHKRIQQLQVSHKDAERFAAVLESNGGCEDVVLLTNKQATRAAIEKAIFHDLPGKTRPGDTVIIFFSCHGGRTADLNGDEADGFDEYLVPHDGRLGEPETMIIDDTFARWMQELDGREIVIVLDNCYSGGTSKGIKALPSAGGQPTGPVDFFDGEIRRLSKDLDQPNTVVLAACMANQLAWERPSSSNTIAEGSVLTYYLIEAMRSRKGLTVGQAYEEIKEPIEKYVRQTFQAEQNPVLIDNAADKILLTLP